MNLKRNNYNSIFSFIYTFEFCGVKRHLFTIDLHWSMKTVQ